MKKPTHKIRGDASDAFRRGLEWRQWRLTEAYGKSGIDWLQKRAGRVADCGRFVGVRACVSDARRSYCAVARCDDRQCQTCHNDRVAGVRSRLASVVNGVLAGGRWVRYAVLTCPNSHDAATATAYALKALSRFSRTEAWNDHVEGAFASFELTWSEKEGWNPHWNVVFYGRYWPQEKLSIAWEKCVPGCPVVWVKIATDGDDNAREIVKYVTKTDELEPDQLVAAAVALKSKRIYRSYGAWLGIQAEPAREKEGLAYGNTTPEDLAEAVAEGTDVLDCKNGQPLGDPEWAAVVLIALEKQIRRWEKRGKRRAGDDEPRMRKLSEAEIPF